MITFPCAKINLGLNIVSKRADGYHNLETVFYPIPLYDALEVRTMHEDFPSVTDVDLKMTGLSVEGNEREISSFGLTTCWPTTSSFLAYTYIYINTFPHKPDLVAVRATQPS